ncbi:MAG: diacylglycerol kinase family protein, partial [Aestuariivirgaceae bacterium]
MDERTGIAKMTCGLIVNPSSGKRSGYGTALAGKLENKAGVHVRVLERFEELSGRLDELADLGVTSLFISSGDGTVQQIQTELAERRPFDTLPDLGLLPHGTTNMTAADLGLGTQNLDEQARIIADADYRTQKTARRTRPTVRIANPADGQVRHGMFVGTGALWRGTVFCQQAVHKTGLRGEWATFATLAAAIVRSLVSKAGGQDPERISQPHEMTGKAADGTVVTGDQLFFLATTLDKLILGSRPFWGPKSAGLRASIFPYPPPSVPRWLWKSMYG